MTCLIKNFRWRIAIVYILLTTVSAVLLFYQSLLQYALFPWMFSSLNSSFIHRVETINIDGENPTKLRIDNKSIIKKIWNSNETMIYELHVRLPIPPNSLSDTKKYYLTTIKHGDDIENIISNLLSNAYPIYRKESKLFDQYTLSYQRRSPETPFTEYMFLKPKEKDNVIIKCARGDEVNRLCDLLYQTYPQKLLVSILIPRDEIDNYQYVIELANANIADWLEEKRGQIR